jgi:tetratricopeptide (TPR) repeat protein
LDGDLAEANYALANLETNTWRWAAAATDFERALELNPNLDRARFRHAVYLSIMGQSDQAFEEIERARELNPLSLRFRGNVGLVLLLTRRFDEAIKVLKNTLEMDPRSGEAQTFLGQAYAAKGMYPEAIAAFQEAIKLGDDLGVSTQIHLGAAYANAGQREKALATLKRLQTMREYVSPGLLPVLHIALGEREQAFTSLERAYAEHDPQLQYLGVYPGFDPIRSDQRFQDLMRRVGLPQ